MRITIREEDMKERWKGKGDEDLSVFGEDERGEEFHWEMKLLCMS